MSDAVKAIILRDSDKQMLTEAVREKLHQQDFDSTYSMIEEISKQPGYAKLADKLSLEADKYHSATEDERVGQIAGHIEELFERHQWTKANERIERLIKTFGPTEKTKDLRKRLIERKEQRKKELLAAWDEAVKREEPDRSLAVLKELDLYLTPNEGLALQESARDVFRSKLHNLGVQFALAVTDKQWTEALQAGEEIVRDFPNSRMALEIREKLPILTERAKEQQS